MLRIPMHFDLVEMRRLDRGDFPASKELHTRIAAFLQSANDSDGIAESVQTEWMSFDDENGSGERRHVSESIGEDGFVAFDVDFYDAGSDDALLQEVEERHGGDDGAAGRDVACEGAGLGKDELCLAVRHGAILRASAGIEAVAPNAAAQQFDGARCGIDRHGCDMRETQQDGERHDADAAADVDEAGTMGKEFAQAILHGTFESLEPAAAGPRPGVLDGIEGDDTAVERLGNRDACGDFAGEGAQQGRAMGCAGDGMKEFVHGRAE
jgi:hypothetical protein